MDLSGRFFTYDGTSSKLYNMVFAHVNTSRFTSMVGGIDTITVYSRSEKRNYYIGESFADAALRFDAEIVVLGGSTIDPYIRRDVEKWLFHRPGYHKLFIDFDDDSWGDGIETVNYQQKRAYLNCRFINPERVEGNGGYVGYKFTIECDSSMAWQEAAEYEFEFDGKTSNTIDILVDTDTNDYVYPKVTIGMGTSGGDLRILNLSDDPTRTTDFVGLSSNITFVVNGNGVNFVSGGNYAKFATRNFIRLIDGENRLSITGDVASIKIEFQNQRYM